MIQVLERAFTLIEYLALKPEEPRSMGELAALINVSAATCSHIVKTLIAKAYLAKVEPKRGYILGPMAYFIARNGPYCKYLQNWAQPLLEDYARDTQETANLAVMCNDKRYIVCRAQGQHELQVNSAALYLDDIYNTATGRVLLAGISQKELSCFLERKGLPESRVWPEVVGDDKLRAELEAIARCGLVVRDAGLHIVQFACPVLEGEKVIAAVGSFVPVYRFKGAHRDFVLQRIKNISRQISDCLVRMQGY